MPQFIKMGLTGTGYLGKKESFSRSAQKRASRRKIEHGYPVETPFSSIDDVRDYLSGDKIICLLCGKPYRRIGTHIQKIHGVTVDEYKARYNIPWTYGLICSDSSQKYSSAVRKRIDEGWEPPAKKGEDHKKLIGVKKRKCPFKSEIAIQNIANAPNGGKPVHPLSTAPDGSLETFTQRRERLTAKRGTAEFKRKMRERHQCSPEAVKRRGFNKYWEGKKQSDEHKAKRFKKNITTACTATANSRRA